MKNETKDDNPISEKEKLKQEIPRFIVTGLSAVATDFTSYYLLLHLFPHSIAKGMSYILGSIVAFILNKFWTFKKKKKSMGEVLKFILLYSCTWAANVAVNKLALSILPDYVFFAFLCATGTSTILNFIGQKWWVFRSPK